ncbi:MAG: type III PLP-dependent enzyme [Rhodovibrionaceae bacterium]
MPTSSKIYDDAEAVVRALTPSYPVYCLRPDILEAQARRFLSLFPGEVLYAMKCNPHPLVIQALYRAGIRHFDTASLPEIAQISESYRDATSYFMHPVKGRAVIKTAYDVYGVRHFVVDHESELRKIREVTGSDRELTIVVRVETPPAPNTLYHLSSKFGAKPAHAAEILKEAAMLGYDVGISFHVGSQCLTPSAYETALKIVGEVRDAAGADLVCVDVGGGFPARYVAMEEARTLPRLEDFMAAIRSGLKGLNLGPNVDVLCEPGRALVANGCSLLVQVQLRKDKQLYINDGVYGSLSEMVMGQLKLPARLIRLEGGEAEEMETFTLNGPTCDSLDVLPTTFMLPSDVREGDWIEIDQVGAYSNALATRFNGFYPETYVVVRDTPLAAAA